MHYSKEEVFTFIMMLIFSHCNVWFNKCSTLYMSIQMIEWRLVVLIQYLKHNAEFL